LPDQLVNGAVGNGGGFKITVPEVCIHAAGLSALFLKFTL
jgi:hypothetical protein